MITLYVAIKGFRYMYIHAFGLREALRRSIYSQYACVCVCARVMMIAHRYDGAVASERAKYVVWCFTIVLLRYLQQTVYFYYTPGSSESVCRSVGSCFAAVPVRLSIALLASHATKFHMPNAHQTHIL